MLLKKQSFSRMIVGNFLHSKANRTKRHDIVKKYAGFQAALEKLKRSYHLIGQTDED